MIWAYLMWVSRVISTKPSYDIYWFFINDRNATTYRKIPSGVLNHVWSPSPSSNFKSFSNMKYCHKESHFLVETDGLAILDICRQSDGQGCVPFIFGSSTRRLSLSFMMIAINFCWTGDEELSIYILLNAKGYRKIAGNFLIIFLLSIERYIHSATVTVVFFFWQAITTTCGHLPSIHISLWWRFCSHMSKQCLAHHRHGSHDPGKCSV